MVRKAASAMSMNSLVGCCRGIAAVGCVRADDGVIVSAALVMMACETMTKKVLYLALTISPSLSFSSLSYSVEQESSC